MAKHKTHTSCDSTANHRPRKTRTIVQAIKQENKAFLCQIDCKIKMHCKIHNTAQITDMMAKKNFQVWWIVVDYAQESPKQERPNGQEHQNLQMRRLTA